jgi:hypothetical protein
VSLIIQYEPSVSVVDRDDPWCARFARFIPPGCVAILDAENELVAIVPAHVAPEVVPLLNEEQTPLGDDPSRMKWHREHKADLDAWEAFLRGDTAP